MFIDYGMKMWYNDYSKKKGGYIMVRFTDLMELKNDTQRMSVIRERMSKIVFEKLREEFGEEFTRYIDRDIGITENGSKVPKQTIVVDVGDVEDYDKCLVGACVEITVKVKKWNTVVRKDGKTQCGVTLDDYDEALAENSSDEG